MTRSITLAATSLSAIFLVAATLATSASAQEAGRNIDISKKKFPTLTSITPDDASQDEVAQVPADQGKPPSKFFSTIPEDQQNNDQSSETAEIDGPAKKGRQRLNTINENNSGQDGSVEDASSDTPFVPDKFTVDTSAEAAAPRIDSDEDIADLETSPPPKQIKKLPKVLQLADEEAPTPPKKVITPKAKIDAATSDDIDDEEEDFATQKPTEKPVVETAETEDDEEVAPTINKKLKLRYSASLRRYVQVTDEDLAYEAAESEDDSYEVPTYRRSNHHGYGYRRSHSYNSYLPSCEN